MATKIEKELFHTKSGLIFKKDGDLGLLVFSPYTGLIFATNDNDTDNLLLWANKKIERCSNDLYEKALGPGWKIPYAEATYPIPNLLPSTEHWLSVPTPTRPILINWLITGNCPLDCKYCFAEDLMRGKVPEPNIQEANRIANTILSYSPLVVVLTGGDPLVSPHFESIVKQFYGKTGIVVDTSAYSFNEKHIPLLKKYKVAIRISLDSGIPRINDYQRPLYKRSANISSADRAFNAILMCLDYGLNVTIQTVATRKNANDLTDMGDKLYKLGINSWRVFKVTRSNIKEEQSMDLIGSHKVQKNLYSHVFKELTKYYRTQWYRNIALQIVDNTNQNAVILVSPNGEYFTESNVMKEKILIDNKYPKKPRILKLLSNVNMTAHTERYLNVSTKTWERGDFS